MKENLIIIHGGGPTAVLNCSLYGAVREAQASGLVEHVYGAVGGTGGLLKEKLLDFGSVPEEELERLCPQCRSRAEEARCPACGRPTGEWGEGGGNASFDPERYERMKRGEPG